MGIAEDAVEWSAATFLPYGAGGLFAISFVESSFFPVPPDVLLIPLILMDPTNALFYAAVCTIGSVLGALFGYWIGLKGGRPVLIRFTRQDKLDRISGYFDRYGAWAVGIAAFTPIPYKVFTISAGVLNFRDLKGFVIASIIGRGGRFFGEALLLMYFGDAILALMENYFGLVTLVIGTAVVASYLLYKRYLLSPGTPSRPAH